MSCLNEEVNRTEPSLLVSNPCFKPSPIYVGRLYNQSGGTKGAHFEKDLALVINIRLGHECLTARKNCYSYCFEVCITIVRIVCNFGKIMGDTRHNGIWHNDTQHTDTQNSNKKATLSF